MQSVHILRDLIAFPTVSRASNLAFMDYLRDLLTKAGATVQTITTEADRTNLWATIGPNDRPGVLLSGHSDVVPVAGQHWTVDPFQLTERSGVYYGRGAADMKGFLACAIACALEAGRRRLETPLHLAISYDEEIGCVGVRSLLGEVRLWPVRPLLCWIGEPTSMRLATGHKGKMAFRATCIGRAAHSALAPSGLNAIHIVADFVSSLRKLQTELSGSGDLDHDYDVPYSTVHVGTISGGEAVNIVPAQCVLDFEVRHIAGDDVGDIVQKIRELAAEIVTPLKTTYPEANIEIETLNAYPGLDTRHESAIRFMSELTGANNNRTKVDFGTEAGLFSEQLGVPVIVCGPGSMDQGHKPDEYVTSDQLNKCDLMLRRLLDRLEIGVSL